HSAWMHAPGDTFPGCIPESRMIKMIVECFPVNRYHTLESYFVIGVATLTCSLLRDEADSLHHESGGIYTNALVWHYRIYRREGIWLSGNAIKRLEDSPGGYTPLHAYSRDAV
ncbi:MAG TPA: hypothetical protein VKQ30_15820, partial [Ktedonobacterales bacterium]|nr:hypothetical protein [Ktedonobacterales bacterium]